MGETILALTRYNRLGASSRVRVLQYIPALEKAGFKVVVQPLFSDEDLRRLYADGRRPPGGLLAALKARVAAVLGSAKHDIVWLQQELFPFLPFGMEAMLLAGRKVVIDFDDAQHLYYKAPMTRRLIHGSKIERLMARADAVVVGSPAMAAVARTAGAKDVRLIYSAVDTNIFPMSARPDRFIVGWIGTPMTAAQSLHLIRDPLARFLSETHAHALFIGMDEKQFPDLAGERIQWSEAAERDALPRLSVGLCPLDDSPWTRGKSGYKIIQYMAAGKPTLTSPVGIAADLVEDGVTGFHCRTADDWYRRLCQLHADENVLTTQGDSARARAQSRYDSAIAAAELAAIFKSLSRD